MILVMDESYDLILQARLTRKFLPQIAGQASLKVDEKIGTLLIGASGPDCTAALIKAQAEDLLCDLFGQRATFASYTDPTKLYSRRMLPRKVVRKTGLRADPEGKFITGAVIQGLLVGKNRMGCRQPECRIWTEGELYVAKLEARDTWLRCGCERDRHRAVCNRADRR